jgi:hypothetical protein
MQGKINSIERLKPYEDELIGSVILKLILKCLRCRSSFIVVNGLKRISLQMKVTISGQLVRILFN